MEQIFIYKIRDIEDDYKYSQFIRTSRECKKLIQEAIYEWKMDAESTGADNVFDYIETYLDQHDIEFEWFDFKHNTINF